MNTYRIFTAVAASLMFVTTIHAASMESIEARVGFGTSPDAQGFTGFFENGFVQGSPSHTDTVSYSDGTVQVDLNITVEGFDENLAPSGIRTTAAAVGVEGAGDTGFESTRLDTGEFITVTFNDINFSVIGVPPSGHAVDPTSFEVLISTIQLAAFDSGLDTFTYTGVGASAVTGDDTNVLTFIPSQEVVDGDSFTILADSGAFRGLFVSLSANYATIPEPASLGLMCLALLTYSVRRR